MCHISGHPNFPYHINQRTTALSSHLSAPRVTRNVVTILLSLVFYFLDHYIGLSGQSEFTQHFYDTARRSDGINKELSTTVRVLRDTFNESCSLHWYSIFTSFDGHCSRSFICNVRVYLCTPSLGLQQGEGGGSLRSMYGSIQFDVRLFQIIWQEIIITTLTAVHPNWDACSLGKLPYTFYLRSRRTSA